MIKPETIVFQVRERLGAAWEFRRIEYREPGESIGLEAVRMMSQGVRPKYVLLGLGTYIQLKYSIRARVPVGADDRYFSDFDRIATPAGELTIVVIPTLDDYMRVLPDIHGAFSCAGYR